MKHAKLLVVNCVKRVSKSFSTSPFSLQRHYKILVVGAGSGGCSIAHKFSSKLKAGHVGIIEPSNDHFYQPMWTLVGAGMANLANSGKKMSKVIPKKADWLQTKAMAFDPDKCIVTLETGEQVHYDYLVMATGLQLNYDKIKGLPEGFNTDPSLCSVYDYNFVQKTLPAIQNFKGGNAIFTLPNTPIKCSGAPQQIMYLADEMWTEIGIRDKANIYYNSSLPVIFYVQKYADTLLQVLDRRSITVNYMRNLIEVKTYTREAIFQKLDSPREETESFKYDFLHVTPPMSTPDPVRESPLVDSTGFVDVDKETLQHVKYPNIFALGDCSNVPTSKTSAAAATQGGYLEKNLNAVMNGKQPFAKYDGYSSCPVITSRGKCILVEFNYDCLPLETFPFNQAKERRSMYLLKKNIIPQIYWHMMLRGLWNGPKFLRKVMHLGMDGPEKDYTHSKDIKGTN
ncbi:sulfide:quinone oxidoreductase [Mytilus galloprovincialis]|uniref:Sulfide:quinone oxidoreductase, mitochondrial n=2 Tax=Mytilus galloprovincialis TaxID=29158 RepID=A0A8B6BX47_MYTGA|nr:sulfide:quinone oxidoreductase [Mytilus galloprovincialis]